jgi:uncharacterized protein YkwD
MKKFLTLILIVTMSLSCSRNEQNEEPLVSYPYTHNETELDLLEKINNFRDSIGLSQVFLVEHASYKCEEHNYYMISENSLSHDYFYDRSENIKKVCHAERVGEILAYNYITNQSVLQAWLNSAAHDTLIRSEFYRVGISIRVNPENNRKFYTVIFFD